MWGVRERVRRDPPVEMSRHQTVLYCTSKGEKSHEYTGTHCVRKYAILLKSWYTDINTPVQQKAWSQRTNHINKFGLFTLTSTPFVFLTDINLNPINTNKPWSQFYKTAKQLYFFSCTVSVSHKAPKHPLNMKCIFLPLLKLPDFPVCVPVNSQWWLKHCQHVSFLRANRGILESMRRLPYSSAALFTHTHYSTYSLMLPLACLDQTEGWGEGVCVCCLSLSPPSFLWLSSRSLPHSLTLPSSFSQFPLSPISPPRACQLTASMRAGSVPLSL